MILYLLFGFVCLSSASPHMGRIVAGKDAKPGEFPYAVSIRYFNDHFCGGSIITSRWVLTAAHCVDKLPISNCTILYGSINVYEGLAPGPFIKEVNRFVVNPNYTADGAYFHDIALIEVKTPFTINNNVNAIILPPQSGKVPFNRTSQLVGWGANTTDGTVMPLLQKVDITIFEDQHCFDIFKSNYSTFSQICAGGGGKGQCSGDSGSALTVDKKAYGIVSWSDKPCTISPGILTRISSYTDWILRTMKEIDEIDSDIIN